MSAPVCAKCGEPLGSVQASIDGVRMCWPCAEEVATTREIPPKGEPT